MAIKLNDRQKQLIESAPLDAKKEKAIEVKNLKISFKTDNGKVQAVRGVSFDLYKGETLCIVGESGSGKSVTSKAIMGILANNAIVENGQIIYQGEDLLKVSEEEFHRIRGHKIGMIFQDPLSSLNPIVKIGKQITETMLINSDQLKNHYKDLYSKELVAYKNAKVVRDSAISLAKNEFAIKENERIKEIQDVNAEEISAQEKKEKIAYLKSIQKDVRAKDLSILKEKKEKANDDYKAVAPSLKTALNKRKKEAKVENAAYAKKLKEEYESNLKVLNDKKNSLELSQEAKDRITELEKQIKSVKSKYKALETLCYFMNKKKQKLKAEESNLVDPLIKERNELAKDVDAIDKEIEALTDEYRSHIKVTKKMAKKKAIQVMREVGIPQPEKRLKQYPFQFSGGMRQRIVIAIALIAEPDILICDEPTTALDVTIQAQILELINKLKEAHNMSVIFITHDLGVVANMADRVAVMYAGKIAEYGTDKEVFFDPRHPYTWALLSSIPDIDSKEKLESIPGTPPDMIYPPVGDAFAARNKYALAIDFKYEPPLFEVSETHFAATWLEHEDAPKVELPKIVSSRIYKALQDEEERIQHEKQ